MVIARGSGRPLDCDLDDRLFSTLKEFPFHSSQSSSRTLKRLLSTIRDRLARAGFVLKYFKRVPHTLSAEQKRTRVELVGQMLQHLSSARHQGWDYFLTGDES
jgi:hypothetical protein